ncbi:MAG TPA: hypothetical protein VFU55_01130 [Terracidiphilus sp.]|nr:hypothetical protein [Terracidiphilus sp.]
MGLSGKGGSLATSRQTRPARGPFHGNSPLEGMNDRLANHPKPPTMLNPKISSQSQEVVYRALERDAKNRDARARDFAWDLRHLDRVGVTGWVWKTGRKCATGSGANSICRAGCFITPRWC